MNIRLPDIVILDGATDSDGYDIPDAISAIAIWGPSLLAGAVTVQVSPRSTTDTPVWATLQSAGSDVAITVSDVTLITVTCFVALCLHESAAPGADETFLVAGSELFVTSY